MKDIRRAITSGMPVGEACKQHLRAFLEDTGVFDPRGTVSWQEFYDRYGAWC
jgi:hypothetical protein